MKISETSLRDLVPRINIVLVHSLKKANRYLKYYGIDTVMPNSDAKTVSFYDGETLKHIVLIEDTGADVEQDIALLAHEAVHVVQRYFEDIGEEEPSEELRCYVTQAVVQFLTYEHLAWLKKK